MFTAWNAVFPILHNLTVIGVKLFLFIMEIQNVLLCS